MKAIILMVMILAGAAMAQLDLLSPIRSNHLQGVLKTSFDESPLPGDMVDGFKEFCLGFWNGTRDLYEWDIKMFHMCPRCINDTIDDLKEFWPIFIGYVKSYNFVNIYTLVENLIDDIKSHFAPCTVSVGYTLRFLELFRNLDWTAVKQRLMFSAVSNLYSIFNGVVSFITCMVSGRPTCAGRAAGQLFYMMVFH